MSQGPLSGRKSAQAVTHRKCARCGERLPSGSKHFICFECLQKEEDFKDYSSHAYTRDELASLAAAPYLWTLMWRGCVTLLVACVLAIAGGYLGMILFGGVGFLDLLQGDAALATGLVAGFIGGLVLAGWVLPLVPKTAKYEPFARRLANAFTTAAFCWFVPGLLCAMAMRDLVLGVGRFGFRDWAFFLPAVAVIIPLGAALTAAVFANKCKKRILASFDAWCKGTNS